MGTHGSGMRAALRRTGAGPLAALSLVGGLLVAGVLAGAALLMPSPTAALADEPPQAARLALEIEVSSRGVGGLQATVHFSNAGTTPLTFFVPEFHEVVPFPEWRLVRWDGAGFTPYAAPFQSMWTTGDQGTLITLEPGRRWSLQRRFDLVVAEGPVGAEGLTPLPLEPGAWTVSCRYAQADDTIPVGGPNFSTTRRRVAGLWTGSSVSQEVRMSVAAPRVVSLRIDAPREHVPGTPYPLTVAVRNDTGLLASVPGVLTLRASSKPNGTWVARLLLGHPVRPALPGQVQTLGLGVAEQQRYEVDLASLSWEATQAGAKPTTLARALGEGLFALSASFGQPDLPARLDSNGLWRHVASAPAAPDTPAAR